MGERIGDLEMWLANKPDTTAWKQESWDKHEIGKIPLAATIVGGEVVYQEAAIG